MRERSTTITERRKMIKLCATEENGIIIHMTRANLKKKELCFRSIEIPKGGRQRERWVWEEKKEGDGRSFSVVS